MSVDPLTRSYPELTPYQFASNTPIYAIDLDGLEALPSMIDFTGGTGSGDTKLEVDNSEEVEEEIGESQQSALEKLQKYVDEATGAVDWSIEIAPEDKRIGQKVALFYLNDITPFGSIVEASTGKDVKGNEVSSTRQGVQLLALAAGPVLGKVKLGGEALANHRLAVALNPNTSEKWAEKYAQYYEDFYELGETLAGAIFNRDKLRSKLVISSTEQAHYIIPVNLIRSNNNVRRAIEEGFDFNGAINGIPLSTTRHKGSHSNYDRQVSGLIDAAFSDPNNAGKSAKEILEAVTSSLRTTINSSSNKVNELF